jgi:hypothetical protein
MDFLAKLFHITITTNFQFTCILMHPHTPWKTQMWVRTTKKKGVRVCSLACNPSKVEGRVGASGWGLRRMANESIIHMDLHSLNNKLVNAWLEHFLCMDKPRAYTYSQNLSQPDLREATTFPFYVFSMISHGGCIQMSFCPGTPKLGVSKFSKLGLMALWKAITSCAQLV